MARASISRLISARASTDPDETVVRSADGHDALTAAELDRTGNRLARDYRARGVGQDDLVTVALPTSFEFVVACTAIWKLGATPAPISPTMARDERSALEVLHRPALVVGARPVDGTIGWVPAGHEVSPSVSDGELPDAWASCWKAPTSSGSSGRPKIVRTTAPAVFDPAAEVAPFLPRRAVQLVTSPLWHSASFTYAFRGLMTDHCLVLADRFDETTFCDTVSRHRVTWTLLSPSMIHRLMRLPAATRAAADTSSIESVLHMGAPCPGPDKRALIDWLGPHRVHEVYAGSESNGLTMIDGDEWLRRPGSVGRPIGGTEIVVRDDAGTDMPSGQTGVIWMRRDGQSRYSYVGGESRRTHDGWDTLGDIGSVDDDGFLTIVDRQADTVSCVGGAPLYPAQLEQGIVAHPAVRDAVVFGMHDDQGEHLAAVVDIADADVEPATVARFARTHLARYCRTGGIVVGRTPLRNEAGKIRRSALAAEVGAEM